MLTGTRAKLINGMLFNIHVLAVCTVPQTAVHLALCSGFQSPSTYVLSLSAMYCQPKMLLGPRILCSKLAVLLNSHMVVC